MYVRAVSVGVRELLVNVHAVDNIKENLKLFLPKCEIILDRNEVFDKLMNSKMNNIFEIFKKIENSWKLFSVLEEVRGLRERLVSEDPEINMLCCYFEDFGSDDKQVKKFKSPGLNNCQNE